MDVSELPLNQMNETAPEVNGTLLEADTLPSATDEAGTLTAPAAYPPAFNSLESAGSSQGPIYKKALWMLRIALVLIPVSGIALIFCSIYNFTVPTIVITTFFTGISTVTGLFQVPISNDIFSQDSSSGAKVKKSIKLTRKTFKVMLVIVTCSVFAWNVYLCYLCVSYHLDAWMIGVSVLLGSLIGLRVAWEIPFVQKSICRLFFPIVSQIAAKLRINQRIKSNRIQANTMLLLLLVAYGGWPLYVNHVADACHGNAGISFGRGARVIGRECVGISDGSVPFDVDRPDGELKLQAAQAIRQNKISEALGFLDKARRIDPTDAEAGIYYYDLLIYQDGLGESPHVSVILDVTLSGKYIADGREVLQGAFVGQYERYEEYQKNPDYLPIYILIANTGSGYTQESDNADLIGQQIVQMLDAEQAHKSQFNLVGIVDGLSSQSVIDIHIELVKRADVLPMIVSDATSNLISSDYGIFHIPPTNKAEGDFGAYYAQKVLHSRRVAILYREENAYSDDLIDAFRAAYHGTVVNVQPFQSGDSNSIKTALKNALDPENPPDLIYCACYSDEINTILKSLPETGPFAQLRILGGDSFYELGNYDPAVKSKMHRLLFTALAYPGETFVSSNSDLNLNSNSSMPRDFFSDYRKLFGSDLLDSGGMTSYDAISTLANAVDTAFTKQHQALTPADLRSALLQITDTHSIQGVTGRIAFDAKGTATKKALFMLSFDKNGKAIYLDMCGQFSSTLVKPPCDASS